VSNELDAPLTALYVDLEDRVLPRLGCSRTHRRGRKPVLSDAELVCLAVAQQLLRVASERHWTRYARANLAGMFPQLPGQSGYGKRLRTAGPVIAAVITELARDTDSWHDLLRLVDSTPLPCAASRETVKRSHLAGHAGYGYCASHSRYFWGFRLYLICPAEGMPIIWGWPTPRSANGRSCRPCSSTTTTSSAPDRSSSVTRASPDGTSKPSSTRSSALT
jgi:hypothetical protein